VTLRAVELLRKADAVVYDDLVARELLELAPRTAEMHDAGKSGRRHKLEQGEINELMVSLARSGKTVVRLKGGDPYLFGRGGEEAEHLVSRGIRVEVVPGVTSAIAVPAVAGIPVTHRDHASAVTLVTGHDSPTKKGSAVDWAKLAQLRSTIVILMGMKNLPEIVSTLVREGMPGSTPVAIIERGTSPREVVVTGTLDNISRKAKATGVKPPGVIVIGDVVHLRRRLEGRR
jgi:uroporphyrin-III C-methyltransferase